MVDFEQVKVVLEYKNGEISAGIKLEKTVVFVQYSLMTIYILGNISKKGVREKLLLKGFIMYLSYFTNSLRLRLAYA